MKYSAFLAAGLSATLLSGCGFLFGDDGYFRDRSNDYQKARTMPPLKTGPGVDERVLGELYVIPQVAATAYDHPQYSEVPRPEALSSNVFSDNVKIQRLGQDRWIFVSASPAEVWPRVRNFLNSNRLQVERTNAPQGLIETAWLNFRDSPDTRDKYLVRIEQGVQPESTEVHVTHLSLPRDATLPSQVEWPARSSNPERESWMVDELAVNLASEIGSASASLLAQTIGGSDKVSIIAVDQEPVLRIELEMIRAWASLNHALRQEGLEIIDEDSGAGIYYVHYRDPDEREGFFSGWFSRDASVKHYSVAELLNFMSLADTPKNRSLFPPQAFGEGQREPDDLTGYLVLVKEMEGAVQVFVRDAQGELLDARRARELLVMIRRNLI